MLRVCGAAEERDNLSAKRCWCGGLFCGRGGFKASREFRKDFRTALPAFTLVQFDELIHQQHLFDDGALQDKWNTRIAAHKPLPKARPVKCQTTHPAR